MKDLANASIKKHAASIHCSGQLTLVQRKLSNILLLNAYDHLLTQDEHTIPVRLLCSLLGWQDSNNMDGLKDTLRALISTIIEFNLIDDGGEIWQAMTLLTSARIAKGNCTYSYAKELANKFYQPDIFAIINIGIQKNFNSNYALTLYENCVRFIKVGSTGWWDIKTFRQIMGANSETYDEFKRLSSFVIKKAVDEVNEVSDIHIRVEYKREQRKVVSLRFLISPNPNHALAKMEPELLQDDIYQEIKSSELFKRLRAHGISERLVLAWITEDPELACKAVDYTEALDEQGLIKGSKAGYIRRLIEDKAHIGDSDYERNRKVKKQQSDEQATKQQNANTLKKRQTEYQQYLFQQAYQRLTSVQLAVLKDQFLISESAQGLNNKVFDAKKGKFVDKLTQLNFLPWLKKTITPTYTQEDFNAWLLKKCG